MPSARTLKNQHLIPEGVKIYQENYSVYGVRKMWHAIKRAGWNIGRDQIYGLMRLADIPGAHRGRKPITTRAAKIGEEVCPEGLRELLLHIGKSCCFLLDDLGIPIVGELAEFF